MTNWLCSPDGGLRPVLEAGPSTTGTAGRYYLPTIEQRRAGVGTRAGVGVGAVDKQ